MKIFVICLLASIALASASHHKTQINHPSSEEQSNEQQRQHAPWENPENHPTFEYHDPTSQGRNSDEDYSDHVAIDLLPFRIKITHRIENSETLSNDPETKEKVQQLVETKLRFCRAPEAGKNKVYKHCIGRVTGQIMQFIAAVENGRRNFPRQNNW